MMASSVGPVALSTTSVARLRPLARPLELRDRFWGSRQQLVRATGLPYALAQLDRTGRLDNFRRIDVPGSEYIGDSYADSDVYKTLEAALWAGAQEHHADEITDLMAAAQGADGYLHTWFQRADSPPPYSNMQMGHELYCAGHLIQAAVAGTRTGRDDRLLPIATRLADHLVARFSSPDLEPVCGHPLIESAMVELYRTTGEHAYLALASRMIDRRGYQVLGPGLYGERYYQDDVPVRDAETLRGHCVRALYLATGACDVYLENGDPTLLQALERQWSDTLATKTYLTGGVGCRRKDEAFGAAYELPPDHAFAETCAGVASVQWSWRMLLATGEGRYADLIERVLYNVVAAGMSADGTAWSYINTLHRRADTPEHGDKQTRRQHWFRCPCCPPNLMRLVASLGHYVSTTDATGLQLHQYVAGELTTVLAGGNVALTIDTDYPRTGRVAITVDSCGSESWTLSLRQPQWADLPALSVNGLPEIARAGTDGYLRLTRRWQPGDRVLLDLPMPVRVTLPDPRLDGVRGCVAVERGPVVYCLEQADLQVAMDEIVLDPAAPLEPIDDEELPVISASGRQRTTGGDVALRLVPYCSWGNRDEGAMRVWLPLC